MSPWQVLELLWAPGFLPYENGNKATLCVDKMTGHKPRAPTGHQQMLVPFLSYSAPILNPKSIDKGDKIFFLVYLFSTKVIPEQSSCIMYEWAGWAGRILLLAKVETEEWFRLSRVRSSCVPFLCPQTHLDEARLALNDEAHVSKHWEPQTGQKSRLGGTSPETQKYQLIWFTTQPGPINMFAFSDKKEVQGTGEEIPVVSVLLPPSPSSHTWLWWGKQPVDTRATCMGNSTAGGVLFCLWHLKHPDLVHPWYQKTSILIWNDLRWPLHDAKCPSVSLATEITHTCSVLVYRALSMTAILSASLKTEPDAPSDMSLELSSFRVHCAPACRHGVVLGELRAGREW